MKGLQVAFGVNLRRFRTHLHMTQAQLAERIGRSTDLISRIERGEASPSFETIEQLTVVLGVPVHALFGGPVEMEAGAEARTEIERLLAGMSPADISWLAELARIAAARPR
ncbi:helix-turn-helix domain-containing protein [Caulobacter endophyticus]|uniref:HTH cro/C1-type domain-containing protein n=1 Tax=Caulobacter endophyticus TaxID=2172652 RepID=A0A2T9KCR4_9CAUL|nr:helix-turn-helix transcriptional regulator [Caulobacter endophyticus]PVM93641.1 hypothetical protein DDF67_02845 [Caulobacter endophyticus]